MIAGLLVGSAVSAAAAQDSRSSPKSPPVSPPKARLTSACHFDLLATGTVASILDGRNFVLDDGREVRLNEVHRWPPMSSKPQRYLRIQQA
jgi:hypothetical protein